MGMTFNTDKTKVMILKSKKDTYANFVYDYNNLEEVSSYKYLFIFITRSTGTIALIKLLMEGGKLILVLKITIDNQIWS